MSVAIGAARATDPPAIPLSAAIGIGRLICILGVVYVHGWTGVRDADPAAQGGSAQAVLRWVMIELFSRGAVPLLSVISGWLVARSMSQRSYIGFISGKARSLVAPMVAWNAIGLVLVVGAGLLGWIDAPRPAGLKWVVDELFSMTRPAEIGVQMPFLRDLFLCMLAAPWLVRRPDVVLWAVALVAAVWTVGGWMIPILLRPAILLFFVCGILAARHGLAERVAALPLHITIAPFVLALSLKIGLTQQGDRWPALGDHFVAGIDLMIRFAAAAMVWRCSVLLASRPIGGWMLRLEPYTFLLFCSHVLFMWFAGPWVGSATGPMGHPVWPIYFLLQPLLALGFAVGLGRALASAAPATARLLSGGRLGSTRLWVWRGGLGALRGDTFGRSPCVHPRDAPIHTDRDTAVARRPRRDGT